MGMYTGIRFQGIIKEEFRKEFETIAFDGSWETSSNLDLRNFGIHVGRSRFIPCGRLCYMPWNDEDSKFEKLYDSNTGYWQFQCSLKNYESEIEQWIKLLPIFIDDIIHLETLYEEAKTSKLYRLINGKIRRFKGE